MKKHGAIPSHSARIISKRLWPLSMASILGLGLITGADRVANATDTKPLQLANSTDLTERGAYLVTITGCNDCHTPLKMAPNGPEPDMSRMLSGHPESLKLPPPPTLPKGPWNWMGAATNTAFAGPWGISFAANLTPDKETGLGAWSEEIFMRAIRTGKHLGALRPIMPPMPWPSYSRLSEEDLKAMFAYLQTIPPVRNRVPEYVAMTVNAK